MEGMGTTGKYEEDMGKVLGKYVESMWKVYTNHPRHTPKRKNKHVLIDYRALFLGHTAHLGAKHAILLCHSPPYPSHLASYRAIQRTHRDYI